MTIDAPPPQMNGAAEEDVRPRVAGSGRDLSLILTAVVALLGGIWLFIVLNAQRQSAAAPRVTPQAEGVQIAPPPPLLIPPPPPPPPPTPVPVERVALTPAPSPAPPRAAPPPPYVPQQPPLYQAPVAPPRAATASSDPALVIDSTLADVSGAPAAGAAEAGGSGGLSEQRVQATRLRRPETTVPQSTRIEAILLTALNSSQPGIARALVTRDVRGFDGKRVLIPRGSTLSGQYDSAIASGVKRVQIIWGRLTRPDGSIIVIKSPASDPLGRGGIRGKVNSHFFERFGSAILQSALTIGENVATSRLGGGQIIVGIPNGIGGGLGQAIPQNVAPPTITVKQGTLINVTVSRDLDFTSVEAPK